MPTGDSSWKTDDIFSGNLESKIMKPLPMFEYPKKDDVEWVIIWAGLDGKFYCYASKPGGGPAIGWSKQCVAPHEFFDAAHDFARKTWPDAKISG